MNNWIFKDEPNSMVMTTKNIVEKKENILSVWHDFDDGMWQFLDGTDVKEEDAMIVSLEYIVGIDDSVNEVSDIPLGWVAWREQKGYPWKRQRVSE
jgi:hypothetical protein